jgi:Fic family protein
MGYQWQSIDDLPESWGQLRDDQVHSVVDVWRGRAHELQGSKNYREFLVKLRRQWAIETGVLERLYTLSEGATRTLEEQGLDAALISHSDTDRPVAEVIALIRDQHAVIDGLYQFVNGTRQLSKAYIRELHQALTAHQEFYDVVDTLGNVGRRPMIRGAWKTLANNVRLEDESLFEFCPPEHVESEMDRLIELHHRHVEEGVPPEVEAAWLHHRFTLIHPFVDGNGRIARALATLVLLKESWFPLVVMRDDKVAYLAAIRRADAGDLKPLVELFGELQRRAVLRALSLSDEVEREAQAIGSILANVAARIERRKEEKLAEFARAVTVSDALHVLTAHRLREVAEQAQPVVQQADASYRVRVKEAARGSLNAGFNRWQVTNAAKQLGYFPNLQVNPSWVELRFEAIPWIGVLVAFHGIGREWIGLMGASAMAYRREASEDGKTEAVDLKALSTTPFEIAYTDDPSAIQQRYGRWLEDALILGLDYWQRHV